MSKHEYFLNEGERGLLVGQTGSGKSRNGIYQLRMTKQRPVIIFDTKIDDAFLDLPNKGEKLTIIESIDDFQRLAKKSPDQWGDFILVRPAEHEALDQKLLDQYSYTVYNNFGRPFIYYDEVYSWHDRGQPGEGLMALLTRGRSRGKTTLMATQRPSWISRFCMTESQKFYIHRLSDARDYKTLSNVIPGFDKVVPPAKYHSYHYQVGDEKPVVVKPVPLIERAAEAVIEGGDSVTELIWL